MLAARGGIAIMTVRSVTLRCELWSSAGRMEHSDRLDIGAY